MAIGMDDVVAAETVLSAVDGERGTLVLRGHPVGALAGRRSFEAVTALLWRGFAALGPGAPAEALGAARAAVWPRLTALWPAAAGLAPADALRTLLAGLAATEPAQLAAAVPAAVALIGSGGRAPAPDPRLGTAADLLRMLRGAPAGAAEAAALDAYLVTVSDHGLNASTFTARVVASTGAGLTPAVVAALGALEGPLHGGAPGPVLDMLDEAARTDGLEAWIDAKLAAGARIMGFGHRIYRVRDPRADVLRAALARLAPRSDRLELAERLERAVLAALARHRPGRRLDTNVEYYTALLLDALGIDRALFTPVFAVGRTAGWIAHAREQQAAGRILRPQSRYVGPLPEAA
ncbi:MAG TPA: citrate synthase [Alphaproteobacteria bacterium]|nr:citrate synthase [Alphaproteobacteria bacterium]